METKKCLKCNTVKLAEEFHKQKKTKDGLARLCKLCYKALRDNWKQRNENKDYFKEHYQENREEVLKQSKEWKEEHKERVKETNAAWYIKNRDNTLQIGREWKENNKEKCVQTNKEWYEKNKDVVLPKIKQYKIEHKEHLWEKEKEYRRLRRKNDPEFKLTDVLRSRLRSALRAAKVSKAMHTIELLGCSPKELIEHLEKQFREGMSWENYGEVWEIDHIKPCASFDLTKQEEQRVCFHYTNLQPLFGEENRKKRDKENYDFTKQ